MAAIKLSGLGVSEGIRIGRALVYAGRKSHVQSENIAADQIDQELERLRDSKAKCAEELDSLIEKAKAAVGEDKAVVLKGQKSFLADPVFCPEMEKLITGKLYSAEKAVNQVVAQFVNIFEKMPSEYMRERAADVNDIGTRMLGVLSGKSNVNLSEIHDEVILVTDDLAPSDTVQLDKRFTIAFAAKTGGKTSHTAIFARTLGIPAVIGIGEGLNIVKDNDTLILDGSKGLCIINPDADTISHYEDEMKTELEQQLKLEEYAKKESVTKDGYKVRVGANIGTPEDASFAFQKGAEEIGLFRTELLYMTQENLPDEETQFRIYSDVLKLAGGKSVIIRTLDIGGDKEVPYLNIPKELNPFLGYRAIRICLDRKELFVTQLRAILRSSVFGRARIMFPMISSLEEWRKAKEILKEVKGQLINENIPFDNGIKAGMMMEVPSAAIIADAFAREADFFSIGTNDLVQYTLAVDRMNEKVANLYDHFHPAVLRLIQHIVKAAHSEGISVGMCGGMAGDPLAIPLLLAMGLDELSMPAASIRKAKYTVSNCELTKCTQLLEQVLKLDTVNDIRSMLQKFKFE